MSYTPYEWHNGETITDVKLNHMENGIAAAVAYDAVFNVAYDYDLETWSVDVVSGDFATVWAAYVADGELKGFPNFRAANVTDIAAYQYFIDHIEIIAEDPHEMDVFVVYIDPDEGVGSLGQIQWTAEGVTFSPANG